MKRIFLWFVLLNKRLYKKITYIGILLLIPVMVILFNISAQEQSGVITVYLGCEDPSDPVTVEIVEQLKQDAIVVSFVEATPEQALEQVQAGKADAAWIFPADMQGKIKAFADEKRGSEGFVRVVEREQTVVLRLAREKLSGVLYERIAKQMYLSRVRENLPETADVPDQELLDYMNKTGVTGDLFAFYDIYGNVRGDSGNYLTAPLRGMLAILATVSAIVTAMYYQKDLERGIFSLLPERHRIFGELGYQLISAVNILIFILIALISAGLHANIWHEALLLVLFALCCSLFGMTVRAIFGGGRVLAVLIPVLALVMLVICPVFFDIASLRKFQFLFPPTYYVSGAYNYKYLWYMVCYSGALAIICFLAISARKLIPRYVKFGKRNDKSNEEDEAMHTSENNVRYETISTEQWKEMVAECGNVPVVMYTRGISMWPLLRADKDSVVMVNPDRPLEKGDIITFLRSDGKEITHRIRQIDEEKIQTIGDNCDAPDGQITHDKVIGLVTHVNHNGREIHVDTKGWRFYGKAMIATNPVRMFVRNRMFRPVRGFVWRLVKGKKK